MINQLPQTAPSLPQPKGRVFFADDADRTPEELVEGPSPSTIRRQIPDGTPTGS
jgi:hypothetical protein